MDVRTLVEIIRARWKIVIAAIAACLLGAMAITALQTKNYQSSATVLMSFSGATSISEFFEATQTSEQRLSSYAEIASPDRSAPPWARPMPTTSTFGYWSSPA